MKIIYIHQHFSTKRGSTGTRSYEMSQKLLHAGHQVTILCGKYDYGDIKDVNLTKRINHYEIDGIKVICIAEPYGNRMSFIRRIFAFSRFARTATKIIYKLNADLIFATSTPLTVGIPGMKGAKHLGVPFIFEVRDLWPELAISMGIIKNPFLIWYLRRLEKNIYFAANRIIALAPGIKSGIADTGYPVENISLIPNSSDLDLFKPDNDVLTDERFGKPDELRLVFTGAHGLANGLDAVLNAAIELKRRGEKKIRFIFIGDGSQKQRLIERSKKEKIEYMINWIPPIPKQELATILPKLDVGMMILKNVPSFYYGTSPNKFFDYISSGLPVINNYPGWLAELIKKNQCGIAVPPDNPSAFADAVIWLRNHPDEMREMSIHSRYLAESEFSRDRIGDLFVKLIEKTYRDFLHNK